nr:putative ribonuclease H-like domain-containing protein [Tanacetum cinerariifolium]
MNDFCSQKGIKKEFSNARTPQQNGVAERRNRSLIEAARTMLADAKLPVTFWAEAVNTACYVQNRVLVNKVFNKRTRRVEENLHVEFLENKAIEQGAGPNWLFDIDSLTKSMNYVPVDAGTYSTNLSGTKDAANKESTNESGVIVQLGKGKGTWEGRVVAFGTVPVCCSFSPSGDFGKFTLLVPGLCLLSFEGLGFDPLAR